MEYVGTINQQWLGAYGCREDIEAEAGSFSEGTLVYHYFNGDEQLRDGYRLWEHINLYGDVASQALCWSPGQVEASLLTLEPHYGDGTYVTFHPRLDAAHTEIKRNHGTSVSQRIYRALLRVKMTREWRRVNQTAGVGLALPRNSVQAGDLIFLREPDDIELIRVEKWHTEGGWKFWT